MRTSFVRSLSPKPRHTSARKGRAIVGAQGGSGSAIPDVELIHPGVSDLDRETPFGNSTGILGVVGAHLLRADLGHVAAPMTSKTPWATDEAQISGSRSRSDVKVWWCCR